MSFSRPCTRSAPSTCKDGPPLRVRILILYQLPKSYRNSEIMRQRSVRGCWTQALFSELLSQIWEGILQRILVAIQRPAFLLDGFNARISGCSSLTFLGQEQLLSLNPLLHFAISISAPSLRTITITIVILRPFVQTLISSLARGFKVRSTDFRHPMYFAFNETLSFGTQNKRSGQKNSIFGVP